MFHGGHRALPQPALIAGDFSLTEKAKAERTKEKWLKYAVIALEYASIGILAHCPYFTFLSICSRKRDKSYDFLTERKKKLVWGWSQ